MHPSALMIAGNKPSRKLRREQALASGDQYRPSYGAARSRSVLPSSRVDVGAIKGGFAAEPSVACAILSG